MGSPLLHAQQTLETFYRLTGNAVTDVFEPQRSVIQKCSAVIYSKRDEIAYGVVVSSDGYILTKATEIEGAEEMNVRIDTESYEEVKVISTDLLWDVALIKVDAKDLTPADFAADSKLEQGTWVVVNGVTSRIKRRVLAGIISANAREIPVAGGAGLGISLKSEENKLVVENVSEGSGAEEAGMLVGDIIIAIDDKKLTDVKEIIEMFKDKKVGDVVKVTISREGKNLDLNVKLFAKDEIANMPDRNDQMSGDFSKRRSGFPRVIQHDILANSDTMGGPVLNMKGQVVGMNIARANRCETFAIPVEELKEITKQLLEKAAK